MSNKEILNLKRTRAERARRIIQRLSDRQAKVALLGVLNGAPVSKSILIARKWWQ